MPPPPPSPVEKLAPARFPASSPPVVYVATLCACVVNNHALTKSRSPRRNFPCDPLVEPPAIFARDALYLLLNCVHLSLQYMFLFLLPLSVATS